METVRAALTEYWITSDVVVASNASLEEFHITQLGEIVWELMRIPEYDDRRDNYWRSKDKNPTLEVEYAYDGDRECGLPEKIMTAEDQSKEDLATIKYTQITYMIKYIDRAFKERDFDRGDRIENAEKMLKELNSIDFGCLYHYEHAEEIPYSRAQIYRLNAHWKYYQYQDIEKTLNADKKKEKLLGALGSATAGLQLLEPKIRDLKEGRATHSLAEKIRPNETLQEYLKLRQLANKLSHAVDAL